MPAECPVGPGLCSRRVLVRKEKVALLRYLLEAHDGLGTLHSDGSGVVSLIAPESQQAALDALIADLAAEGMLEHI